MVNIFSIRTKCGLCPGANARGLRMVVGLTTRVPVKTSPVHFTWKCTIFLHRKFRFTVLTVVKLLSVPSLFSKTILACLEMLIMIERD